MEKEKSRKVGTNYLGLGLVEMVICVFELIKLMEKLLWKDMDEIENKNRE